MMLLTPATIEVHHVLPHKGGHLSLEELYAPHPKPDVGKTPEELTDYQ